MSGIMVHSQPHGHSSQRSVSPTRLRSGLLLSAGVHVLMVAAVIFWSTRPQAPRPPVYRVNLVGAPPGPRQVGVVSPQPATPAASDKPAPSGAEQLAPPPKAMASKSVKAPAPSKATPTPAKSKTAGAKKTEVATNTAPPKAGSGSTGGKGADVANVRTEGIAFPDEGYLANIVRQLTLTWQPRRRTNVLVTEVKFTIRRDGTVADMQVVKGSGDREYDLDAQGAIEAVRRFGPLPAAWKDDVLIVYFTFDYALLK